ncbi:PBECR4 domain-containing protein [Streptococcus suis]
MVEEHTNQPSSRGKSRRERVEHARSRDILDVANELHMELVRSGRDYRWKEHDSMVISPDKNMWNWFSRHQGGDVIALVQTMKEINFNQAIDYLNDGAFKEFITVERVQESFNYYLKPYEQPFEEARNYLKEQRGLSDETIDFFLEKGVIAQANAKVNGSIEPVVVFKSFDFSGEIVGATLQGIEENWEKWHERGYAKNIVRNSDGITGMHVDIGQPNRLIFAESAIDLMSYYELNKANLQDVRLISMDGLKEGVIGRHLAQLQSELSGRPLRWNHDELAEGLQTAIDNNFFMDGKHADWITLAVDNDEAGRNFISSLREKGAVVTEALPDLQHGQEKMDWNDALKSSLSDQISKIDQPEIVEDYQNQVYELIADITQDDTAYYLWHDEELHNLGAGDSILEEFHGKLEDRKYPVAGAELYVEESSNDGATGYLSLEGHVLDRDGILDYLSDQEFSDLEKVEFLTKLQTNLPEIWDKVLNHYEDTFKVVVDKYELKSSDAPLIQNKDTESIQEEVAVSEEKENPLDSRQEVASNSGQNKKERTSQYKGSLQPEAEGSTAPVSETDTFDRSVTSRPTRSSHYLEFTINGEFKSRKTRLDTSVDKEQLAKINRFADTIQSAARFYQEELANSKINYFTSSGDVIQVNFLEKNFVHLTGLKFIGDNQTPEKTLRDLAAGGTHSFDDIRISNTESAFSKVKVLPELKAALQTDSFYFDNLQNIPRYTDKFHSLIKSSDQDLMLLFRDTEESGTVPVSVFKSRAILEEELLDATKNEILGIYRDRDGVIEQIDVNEKYISDGGQEMLSILENKQYEEAFEPTQEIVNNDEISSELFTKVLDAAYNVGDPRKLGTQVPDESKVAWERYYELSDKHEGNFGTVVEVAVQMGLIDKESNFYQEWNQDRIYNENYHVRLQWSEDWEERGPQLPFNATDLIDYGAFAEELYRQNNSWRSRHIESIQEESNVYIPYTKVKFDVYAPGGALVKDNVRYDIGDETEPISRLLGLGYRRLEGQNDLAAIDEEILSQMENQEVNLEIATEANEQSLKSQEILQDEANSHRESFQSPHQKMKTGLAQRIEEIMAEETAKNQVKEGEQDYTVKPDEPFDYTNASAYEISEHAFQKIREYTQSPEDLLEYMDFMSKFPQLSPRNVALIHEQWRGANAVATYDQWQGMGESLGVKPEDVIQTKASYTNKRTGETKEVVHQGLSVKTGEKSQITLFRPLMVKMIPVLDETGNQIKNDRGNPKFKKLSEATPQEKALVKDGKLPVRQFQERDSKTGYPRFTTYKVFELSQTTLKPESYPKAMPNRHYNFNVDKVKTKEVLEGLCDYAESLGIKMMNDEAHVLGNAKGAFYPGEQLILINPDNTPGEKIATTIHELAHATLHNPKLVDQYKDLPKGQKELEAEMTSHILSKHFGLDTSEKAINYMANWTSNLKALDDKQLADSLKRVHKTVSNMMKHVENHTKPYSLGKNRGQSLNFPDPPTKGPSR